jgi:hypothetical protein
MTEEALRTCGPQGSGQASTQSPRLCRATPFRTGSSSDGGEHQARPRAGGPRQVSEVSCEECLYVVEVSCEECLYVVEVSCEECLYVVKTELPPVLWPTMGRR